MFRKAWKGNVGLNIRRLRLARKITQESAAEAFPCSLRHWQRLEGGTQNPSLIVMVRIARLLRVKPERLLQWRGGRPGPPK